MKKNLFLIIILMVLIVVCIALIFILKPDEGQEIIDNPSQNSGDVVIEKSLSELVIVEDVVFKIGTANRNINCVFPKVTSLKNKEFQNYINNQIAQNIQAYRDEIEFIIDEETPVTALYVYNTSYGRYNCGKYLSLVIDQNYQTGGIRSNKWKDIYNINAETERIFYLNELFDAGIDFESAIIAEIAKQAEQKNYEMMGGNGLTKLPTKQKFYIKDDKLFIYFAPSEGAATVFGELHFEMPFVMNEETGFFEIN